MAPRYLGYLSGLATGIGITFLIAFGLSCWNSGPDQAISLTSYLNGILALIVAAICHVVAGLVRMKFAPHG